MPAPSSVTVIVRAPAVSSEGAPSGASMVTQTRVAPALRQFWSVSTRASVRFAANMRVTR